MRKSNIILDLRKKEKEFRNPMINRKKDERWIFS